MSLDTSTRGFGWRAVQVFTVLVYVFMFAPILVVIVLSFNASQFGGFPMTGFSLHWYAKLMENELGAARLPDLAVGGARHGHRLLGAGHPRPRWRWCATSFPARNG